MMHQMSEDQTEMIYTEAPGELSMSTSEALFTQRAIRRFGHDRAVSDAHIKILLDAAKAPNGGSAQPGRFLVVRDPSLIHDFGKVYHEAWWAKRRDDYGWSGPQDILDGSIYRWGALLLLMRCPRHHLSFWRCRCQAGTPHRFYRRCRIYSWRPARWV